MMRGENKFKKFKIQTAKAAKVKSPVIKDAFAGLECRVITSMSAATYTVYLAEVVHLAPQGQTSQATGGCLFFTFLGVVVTPPLFNLALSLAGSYAVAYAVFGVPSLAIGVRLLFINPSHNQPPR